MNNHNIFENELYGIIHGNKMYDYEETNMAFIAAKLIHLQMNWNRNLSLVLRSDFINDKTYWFIRYFRSKNVEPSQILSTALNKRKHGGGSWNPYSKY